ncbi:MAG: chloramphenicol acetyltransferase [Ignavibacteriae bacterium]|nr:chloramphenicol acetyltransferase [Ignavibacteriota bacterium]
MKIINKDNWKRKEHYNFFSQFEEPFFGIVTEIECTNAYKFCKENKISFFAYYLHKSILSVNQVTELRTRIVNNEIVLYDEIHATSTIARADETFGFSFIPFNSDFNIFNNYLKQEIQNVQNSSGLRLTENSKRLDVIHYSPLPWIKFSALSHARNYKMNDSVPKLCFGKMYEQNSKLMLPVSVHAHHGLADAFHAAKYFELLQNYLINNEL